MPKSDTPTPSFLDRILSPIGITVVVIVIIILSLGAYLYARRSPMLSQQNLVPTLTPTPTPTPRAIPHGKKGFTVSQSDRTIPQFSRGFIDPYDPDKGATQSVMIAVKHSQPVTKVTAVLKTDNNVSTPVPFTLINGTNTNGEWLGSWRITDTYLYTYALVLEASSASGSGSVVVTLR